VPFRRSLLLAASINRRATPFGGLYAYHTSPYPIGPALLAALFLPPVTVPPHPTEDINCSGLLLQLQLLQHGGVTVSDSEVVLDKPQAYETRSATRRGADPGGDKGGMPSKDAEVAFWSTA